MSVAAVASGLPLALSFLQTVANQYPGLTKSQPTTTTTVVPAVALPPPPAPPPLPPPPPAAAPAAPVVQPSANQTSQTSTNTPPNNQANGGTQSVPVKTPPATSSSSLCENCHLKPKYFDGTKTHQYCSKTCARAKTAAKASSRGLNQNGSASTNPANCDFCHIRPKFSGFSYCSKTCARNSGSSNHGSLTTSASGAKGLCHAPGCQKPAHINTNGSTGEYCSLSHKALAESICLMCLQAPKLAQSQFCSRNCEDEAEKKGPIILEVPAGHVTFKSVTDQFKASWRHPGTICPPVKRVYKIIAPKAQLTAYDTYRASVEARGQFVAAGRSPGNENRRWHGTRRECHLGDKGQTQFCSSLTCSLCCIVRTSFDLSLFGKKTGWGRFGRGIYTSSTSSKSNDYSQNDCKSPLKAILLNKVVVGKGCKMTQDNTSLVAPPTGYDSVLAEKGGTLNYDELVVYTNDAIRPSFLVMYEA
ncbi:hypothetical protein D9758_009884 [Tetrapyrgos nigripes]|uniref:PARP catalytic domain-containing protein n=1 Tax=Tetrapyrgos nigripes TaxID=182062 RepID=A0A8H5GMG7_9AGAR|nr:hypothetical protein D9758_009884 [Tetrapyrgos nigripes]